MTSFVNTWFGLQEKPVADGCDAVLQVTDGNWTIDFLNEQAGWALNGPDGWNMKTTDYNAVYSQGNLSDGDALMWGRFGNVVETMRFTLYYTQADSLLFELDILEEMLKVRAPRFAIDDAYNSPVYLCRRLHGESEISYCEILSGSIAKPTDMFDSHVINRGVASNIQVSFVRKPFWLASPPGVAQGTVESASQQKWDYDLLWAVVTSTNAGQNYAFAENGNAARFMTSATAIQEWSSGSSQFASATVTPASVTGPVTSAIALRDNTFLFGDSGQIISYDPTGPTWAQETTLPSAQVYALVEANDGVIYASDDDEILKRDRDGTWASDSTLPTGNVLSFVAPSWTGRVIAGGTGEIFRTGEDASGELEQFASVVADQAEQYRATMYVPVIDRDLDFGNNDIVGVRMNLAIPANAVITSCKFKFTARRTRSGTMDTIQIQAEDVDDASAIATTDDYLSGLTLTTASVSWGTSTKWRKDRLYSTPDISPVLQEIIDRNGWASGQDVLFVFTDPDHPGSSGQSGRREAWSAEGPAACHPLLVVEWTVATDDNWELVSTLPVGDVSSLYAVASERRILAGGDGETYASYDNGKTWHLFTDPGTAVVEGFALDGDNILWHPDDDGNILRSPDFGANWSSHDTTTATGPVQDMHYGPGDENLFAADNAQALWLQQGGGLNLGRAATKEDEVLLGNHHIIGNLTHAYVEDNSLSAFTSLYPAASFPFNIFGAITVAVSDAVYFIQKTSLTDATWFNSIVFDIGTIASSTTSYTLIYEYWDSAAWSTLTVNDGTSQFTTPGVNTVSWIPPTDWATTAVNSVTGYAVRCRVSALTGTFTTPTQQNRDFYTASRNHLKIEDNQILGSMSALASTTINIRSSNGTPDAATVRLHGNRIVAGVKAVAGHENFRAFLNFSTENNPEGVSVDATVDGDSATSTLTTPGLASAGKDCVFIDGALTTLSTIADRVALKLNTTIARDFYGRYRVFLRGKQTGGTANEIKVRLKVVTGTGGVTYTTESKKWSTQNDHHVLEFDQTISIPVSSTMSSSDLADVTQLVIQTSNEETAQDLYLYDIFLLPVDIAYLDAEDRANTNLSDVGNDAFLYVDSITQPKVDIQAFARTKNSNHFKGAWRTESRGPFVLPKLQDSKIWFLVLQTTASGTFQWVSPPEIIFSASVEKTDRWIQGRGAL